MYGLGHQPEVTKMAGSADFRNREFATIAALILRDAQNEFPLAVNLDFDRLAQVMGVIDRSAKLESGQSFDVMASNTLKFLIDEGYVKSSGLLTRSPCRLTEKGYAAVKHRIEGSKLTFGQEIEKASESAKTNEGRQKLADLFGSFAGSFAASYQKGILGT
jgi:hypothetical protein